MKYHDFNDDFNDDQPELILTHHGLPTGLSKEELEQALISMKYGIAYVDSATTVTRLKTLSTTTNCKNCGAPIKDHICEYCGSEYQY